MLVYAGSAQLVAVGLFASGAALASIVATTFAVNLRHVLFAAAMSPLLRGWRKRELAAFAFELTDESFALHAARFGRGDRDKGLTLTINVLAQASWVAGTALGILAGLFADRPVVGIHAVDLVLGFGTLHCLTQQQPAAR